MSSPSPTNVPSPTAIPSPTAVPSPTAAPSPTAVPSPTAAPSPPTVAPSPTAIPSPTAKPSTASSPTFTVPTASPTPADASTFSPVTFAPSAPTMLPTIPPTFPPTVPIDPPTPIPTATIPTSFAVVTVPTSVPPSTGPCNKCTAIITPGNSSNGTVTLGPTGGPVIVTVPPTAVPDCNSCSVTLLFTPTPSGPSGGTGVLNVKVLDDDTPRTNVTLDVPFTYFMPFSLDLAGCGPVNTNCVWQQPDTKEWLSSGCSAQPMSTGTLCTCTHFTDFAVLLDSSSPHPCGLPAPSAASEVYSGFLACYAVLLVYCLLAVARLWAVPQKQGRGVMLLQHGLVGAVCVLRMLWCLNHSHVFGNALGLSAFVSAAPYPLEYLLFTKFVSTWAGLVHFAMLSAEARWKKIRPLFYGVNVVGTALAVGLFVMFYMEASFESALAGTIVLALLYVALAAGFGFYSTKLVNEMVKAGSRCGCGMESRIQLLGSLVAVCFVAQALCDVLALALPSAQLVGWTAAFAFFNALALLCVLLVYSAAVFRDEPSSSRLTDLSGHSGSSTHIQTLKI